jgi:FkbM family methyltransferase
MPLRSIQFTLNTPTAQRQLRFELDEAQMSQRIILQYLSQNQLYEPETTALVHSLLQPGDGFIDIGAHVGFFTILAAHFVGPAGRVYCFEPDRANYQHLLSHLALNGLENVFPFPWAVGSQSKVVDFFFNADNDGGHALWNPGLHPFNEQSRQKQETHRAFQFKLDDLFRAAAPGSIKLIKIDTEGNEPHVLRGAQGFLRSARVPAIIAEVNQFGLEQLKSSEKEMRDLMGSLGYVPYLLKEGMPTRLAPDQFYQSQYVFNLLFVSSELQGQVAGRWPQATATT